MKKLCFLAALSLSFFSLHAIEGDYQVTGWDPYENKPYNGTAHISKDDKNVYQAEWKLESGAKAKGTGLQKENEISFVFLEQEKGEKKINVGVQVYTIDENTLEGGWVLVGESKVGNEKLEKK